jgi:hypothetical protein
VVVLADKKWTHETRLGRAGKRQTVYNIIHNLHEMRLSSIELKAHDEKIEGDELRTILKDLEKKGLVYSPKPGLFACVDESL